MRNYQIFFITVYSMETLRVFSQYSQYNYAEKKELLVYRYNGKNFDEAEIVRTSDGIASRVVSGGNIPLTEIFGE